MSTVSITITLDRYICTELGEVRTMIKNLDFSTLPAIVERIQKHANTRFVQHLKNLALL